MALSLMFRPAPKICLSQHGLICSSGVHIATYVFLNVRSFNFELEGCGTELWCKTCDQNSVFPASSCMQVMHESPVRLDIFLAL
jgi:hypothetical protein